MLLTVDASRECCCAFTTRGRVVCVMCAQVLDASSGKVLPCAVSGGRSPVARGWTDACRLGKDKLVVFGGLAGDDDSPTRLADTWVCQVRRQAADKS